LRRIIHDDVSQEFHGDPKFVKKELHDIFKKEEVMYRQRSRIEWLKEGIKTKSLQNRVTHRSRKNTVQNLRMSGGTLSNTNEEMSTMVLELYHKLCTTKGSTDSDHVLNLIETLVTAKMNHALKTEFSNKEITNALFQMGPTKAPGLDELPALFYQRHWSLLKAHVLVLIPKVSAPELLTQFHPITSTTCCIKFLRSVWRTD
jgi:hypothetical protein